MIPLRTFTHRLLPIVGMLLFAAAVWVLWRQLQKHPWSEIVGAFRSIPASSIAWAIVWTAVGYWILTGYDFIAMHYINHAMKYRRIALAAFIGYAFSNSIGHSFLTGGGVRFRLYSLWGVSGVNIAKVVAFGHVAFYMGMLLLIGQGCLIDPNLISDEVRLPPIMIQILGAAMISLIIVYFIWTGRRNKPLNLKFMELPMPSLRLSLAQLVVATLDLLLVAAVLYVLLPTDVRGGFLGFAGLFITAQVIGIGSQVPGGLGVFETIMLHVLASQVATRNVEPEILAALVVFRIMYFIVPLILGVALLFFYEVRVQHRSFRKASQDAKDLLRTALEDDRPLQEIAAESQHPQPTPASREPDR